MFAFTYKIYNLDEPDADGYQKRMKDVEITVVEEDGVAAEAKVRAMVPGRGNYILSEIAEMSELYPSRMSF